MTKKDDIIKKWASFSQNKDFALNPDSTHVDALADGILVNKKKYGLSLCPCRLRDGTRETDLKLICPCNFKAQDNWEKLGRCWCGLFVKN